ncbi:MAG: 4-hydroxy-tetrahydrodipicolinate synthase [Rhodospirillales bacterium]
MFIGSCVALITPFTNGTVDEKAFQKFVQWQIDEGTEGVVPVGTTGESPTLSHEEHMRVVELCIEVAAGKIPVIAGAGSNSTSEAIMLTQHAEKAGADGALVVTPYYNKPSQEGLYQHFKAIHDATNIPVVIYNIPGRSIVDMTVDTMSRLARLPRIVGLKDATADLSRPQLTTQACGTDFCQLSGEDASALPYLAAGGHGCISVSANVAPGLLARMHRAWRERDIDTALEIQRRLTPLHKAMFCEPSPGPAKYAAELLGLARSEVRQPILELTDAGKKQVREAMTFAGLLN